MFQKFFFLLTLIFIAGTGYSQKMNVKITPIDSQFLVHTSYKKLDGNVVPANGLIVNTPKASCSSMPPGTTGRPDNCSAG